MLVTKMSNITCEHTVYKNITYAEMLVAKIPIITLVHTLYKSTNTKIMARYQHVQSNMCTYHVQQHHHTHRLILKFPLLHVYIRSIKTQP